MKTLKSKLPEITLRYRKTEENKVKVSFSRDAFAVLRMQYDNDTIDYLESAVVLFLNRNNITIGWMKLSQGGQNGTVVDGKVLFAAALQCGASRIILSHNHPSGNLQPRRCRTIASCGNVLFFY